MQTTERYTMKKQQFQKNELERCFQH